MAQNHQHKPTTLDDLAVMINQGFTETQRHVDARIDEVKHIQQDLLDEMTATHEDVRYLRRSVDMLVRNDVAQDAAIKTLTARVTRLEKKVGLTS
jgi:polyhydroxyalkanoate synthesis regulator phasin